MIKLAIASVDAFAPKPFTILPFLALVLASQVGTAARYIQEFPADASIEDMEGEARSIELGRAISQDDLDANWRLDVEELEAEEAQLAGDADDAAFEREGAPEIDDEFENAIEPLV